LRILFITNFWQNIEHKASDVFFIIRGEREISGDIVIVGIGDDTFSTLNERWPFPRTYHAKLIENLEKAGVSQIIYDIEFTERTNIDADSKLAATIAKYDNIILSGKLIRTQYNGSIREQFLSPIPILTQTDTKWGTVNISSDIDGFVRRYDLFQKRAKEIKLSIGTIAMAQRYQLDLNSEDIHNYSKYFQIGSKYIPKATSRSAFINYFGPTGTFTTYDFADVIDDSTFTTNFEKELNTDLNIYYTIKDSLENKIVFIGLTALEFHDMHRIPFFTGSNKLMPGVEIHANFMETVLRNNYLNEYPISLYFLFFFIVTLLLFIFNSLIRPSISVFINFIFIIVYIWFSYYLFSTKQIFVPILEIPTVIIIIYILGLVYQYIQILRERKFIKHAFGHYIAPELVEELIKNPKNLEYGGVQKELTIIYVDLVSFTPYTESHTPKETVNILREYLTEMINIITENKGTLDKFVGDEIIALFGAPVNLEDHAFYACKAALEMRQRMNELHKKWVTENKDPLEMGIGINTGFVTIGNLGSEQIFDYTAIGDNMNICARIESLTRDYNTTNNIIINNSTYEYIKDKFKTKFIDEVTVKGKKVMIKIHELISHK
jgi:adenylate cyclase